ncbi:hypothetical protein PV11_10121 [Exophiala sideris]|uniref:Uncharacterized protein n=1 Tax=Exophiala sideris TaxID=1016849 RepID=A0A0D1YC18_9EURO|nr:hypothetical protein PV11_10121 [Exophiala sideris]
MTFETVHEATELTEQKVPTSHEQPKSDSDYDPCSTAKITSPFYLYKHDSPRPSFDVSRSPPQLSLRDLEAGMNDLSPSVSQEKRDAQEKKKQCLTRPKQRGCAWLKQLPPRQRLMIKMLIALVIIGAMVGLAVGITIAVHGGVYKNNNQTTSIG